MARSMPLEEKLLWPIFDGLSREIIGIEPSKFEFVPRATPLSTLTGTLTLLVIYYTVIFTGREFMRNREAFKLNTAFKVHNLCLSIASSVMLVLFTEQLIPTISQEGVFDTMCGTHGWTQPLVVLYYVSTPSRKHEK